MTYHGHGIYAPNEGPVDVGRILDIIRGPVGEGAVVLLAHQVGKDQALKRIHEGAPDALIQIRRYVQDWTEETPQTCAVRFVDVMEHCRRWTVHGTWANEQNLAAESRGKVGADVGRRITWDEWRRIADYNYAVAAEVRRLAPWIVLHYPGMAYGHGEDWGYRENLTQLPGFPLGADGKPLPAYELLRPGIDLCPILNHHPYVQHGAPVLDPWLGVRRIERTIALFPGKTLFVAETGDFDVRSVNAPDRIVEIAYYLQGRPEVLGWCFFILDSPDPGHAMNNWSENREIEAAYKRMTRIARPRTWSLAQPTPAAPAAPSKPNLPVAPAKPPQEAPVTDIKLSVPMRDATAHADNFARAKRPKTLGVVIHTTRGGTSSAEKDYSATINWLKNPDAGVSAHLVVGAGRFSEVARCVPDDEIAFHARELNGTHLGIEIAQPEKDSAISDFQYRAAAEAVTLWAARYGFPVRRVLDQAQAGIIGHEDSAAGKRDGKSDPGPVFDWPRFLALAGAGDGTVTGPPAPAPAGNGDAVTDALNGLAHRLNEAERAIELARAEMVELKTAIER